VGWSKRSEHCWYYYRFKKVKGKVVATYVGHGPEAERQAALDAEKRKAREAQWAGRRAELETLRQADGPLRTLFKGVDLFLGASLVTGGYKQHDRGEWRPWPKCKSRRHAEDAPPTPGDATCSFTQNQKPERNFRCSTN
jgi:hypothetical protein